ncbi:hypothetical protein ACF0H5_011389 [Mactra antiquata]
MLTHLRKGRQLWSATRRLCFIQVSNKSTSTSLEGILVAPFTPFNKDGSVNYDEFKDCMKYFKDAQFNGLFVNGTLGEGMALSCEERMKTAEKWKEVLEGMSYILHIGTGNIEETKMLAQHAEQLGVDAIAALPPTYYKPQTEEQLIDYMEQVAESAPNTRLMYYEYNLTTGVNLNMPRFLSLAEKRIPTLYGLKHTTQDLNSALACTMICDEKYKIFYGSEALYLPSLSIGLPDIITSPFMGKYFNAIKKSYDGGDLKMAQDIQKAALSLSTLQAIYGKGIGSAKGMFEILSNCKVGPPRLPLQAMSEEYMKSMREVILSNYGKKS